MPQVTFGMLPSHQVGLQDQLLNIVVEKAAQCHGVMGYLARFKSCYWKLRITNRDTTLFDLYLMISMFLLVSFTCSRLWSIKDTAVPWSLVQIHPLPGTSRSGRGKGQIGRRCPRTWVLKSWRIPSRHHGWMAWIIFRDKTGNLHFESFWYLWRKMYLWLSVFPYHTHQNCYCKSPKS